MMDESELARTLDKIGWDAKPYGDQTYKVMHETAEGPLTVYVRLTDNWLIASVVPFLTCLLYTSPSPRDLSTSRMPSSA